MPRHDLPMSILNWSSTPADNDDADLANGIDWREGQLASSVNNSNRAIMAAVFRYVRDTSGDLTTTGSANAYVLTTAQTIASLAEPLVLAFKANFTNTAAATINVDGLGAIEILRRDGTATQAGDIVSTGCYLVAYSGALSKFIGLNISANALPIIATVVSGAPTSLLNNSTSAQNIFASANDVLTVAAATTYRFQARIALNTGNTSHTTAFGLALTTATLTSIHYTSRATSSAADTLATPQMRRVSVNSAAVLTAASTAVTTDILLDGIIRVNAAGQITPQITFSAGPTGTCEVEADSYFAMWPLGSNTLAAIGDWA